MTGTRSVLRGLPWTEYAQQTPEPEVGVDQVVDLWPVAIRAAWFLVGFAVVVIVGWVVVTPIVSRTVRHRNPNNPTLREAVVRYMRLAVVIVGLAVGAATAGYGSVIGDSALIVAAATLALGVAGQTVIGSLVSGLVLVVDPEFNVGDYIEWEDGEGTVQSITLRVTRVLTQDGELVTVPNTVLTDQTITRPFGRGRYRMADRVDVAYGTDLNVARAAIEAAIDDVAAITDAPSPRVYIEELGEDGITIATYYWIAEPKQKDVLAIRSAFARAAVDELRAAGVDISPASQRELSGRIDVADENGTQHGPG